VTSPGDCYLLSAAVPTDEQAQQKCRSAHQSLPHQGKTRISLTTVAGQSSMDPVADGLKAWSSKPFIYRFRGRRWDCDRESLPVAPGRPLRPVHEAGRLSLQEETMTTIRLTLGLSQRPARARAWHLRTVIIPRRTITGRLVRGQVWRRHDGRHWVYKKFIA
jgi:hypothetical protein